MSYGLPNPSVTLFSLARARVIPFGRNSLGVCAWPTDAIGTFALTLTNVVVGSRIHIEKQDDGTQLHDSVASDSTVAIDLSVYAAGSAYNALRIKVRKASAGTSYKPFETLATAIVGSQSIYVGQIADE